MFLLAGLGNIGDEYQKTRHNFGFLALDAIIAQYNLQDSGQKFGNWLFMGEIAGCKIMAIKPQKLMNLSGEPILKIISFYNVPLANLLVLHDDLDLELGRIKLKMGGGNAGHNGLRDIERVLGKDYLRLRLGIGRPQSLEYDVANYVLGKFSKEEILRVKEVNQKIAKFLPLILDKNYDGFSNSFYRL